MKFVLAVFLMFVAASPLFAGAADNNNARVADFIRMVNSGESLDQFVFEPKPTVLELSTMTSLAGCRAELGEGSHRTWIELNWTCPANSDAQRETALKFDEGGGMSLWINPHPSQLVPTPAALSASHLPSQREINRQFATAVKEGGDPTLGGLVTIIPEHRQKLSALENVDYLIPSGNSKKSQALFWDIAGKKFKDPIVTNLEFDSQGRPLGLVLSTTSKIGGSTNG